MENMIAILAVLVSVIFAFLFGRGTRNSEKRLKTRDTVERMEKDAETQDDETLANRISRKP